MGLYNVSKAATLSASELASLKVTGVGVEVNAKVAECNNYTNNPAGAVLMSVEQGQVKGCR